MSRENCKPTFIDGKPYICRLLTGGVNEDDKDNEWDKHISPMPFAKEEFNINRMFSWTASSLKEYPSGRAIRGSISACNWYFVAASFRDSILGFRPCLVPLVPDTLEPDTSDAPFGGMHNGDVAIFGTLYLDGEAQRNPEFPTDSGDIPRYRGGQSIRIGDSHEDPAYRICWVRSGNLWISNKNLLKSASWNDLDKQGLVFGN